MKSSTTFGDLLSKHRDRLGEPVSLEEIFLLHDAAEGAEELSEEQRIALLDRVAADPEAAQKLRSLIRFPEGSSGAEDGEVEERWKMFQAQLPATEEGDLGKELPPAYQVARTFGWQQVVGLAAALLLCVSFAFWAGTSVSTRDASQAPAVQLNTYVVELSTSGQRSRGGQHVTWPADAEGMLLTISAPEIESAGPFELVVLNAAGERIVKRAGLRPDSAGLFFATLARELLPPGDYDIQLRNDVQEVLSSLDLEIKTGP